MFVLYVCSLLNQFFDNEFVTTTKMLQRLNGYCYKKKKEHYTTTYNIVLVISFFPLYIEALVI